MSGKMSFKGMMEEELMEVQAICDNYAGDLSHVLTCLDKNERLDHDNDKTRIEARKFLYSALKNYKMRDFDGMDNDVHSAIQRLHDQEVRDFEDDQPRAEVKIQLSLLQLKFVQSAERIRKILGKLNQKEGEDASR